MATLYFGVEYDSLDPVTVGFHAARAALIQQEASELGLTVERSRVAPNAFWFSVEAPATQIAALLEVLTSFGIAGLEIDVESDEDVELLRRYRTAKNDLRRHRADGSR